MDTYNFKDMLYVFQGGPGVIKAFPSRTGGNTYQRARGQVQNTKKTQQKHRTTQNKHKKKTNKHKKHNKTQQKTQKNTTKNRFFS